MPSEKETTRLLKLLEERLEVDKILSDNLGSGFETRFHEAEGTEEIHRILTTEIIFLEQLIEQYPENIEVPNYSLSQYKTFQHHKQNRNQQDTLDKFFE
jgi:hypothetical protein